MTIRPELSAKRSLRLERYQWRWSKGLSSPFHCNPPSAVPPIRISTLIMPADQWTRHQWTWATEEQKEYIREIAPYYRFAVASQTTDRFWRALRTQWFLRWSIIPELVWLELLPPEAGGDDYAMTEQEKKCADDYEDRRWNVSCSPLYMFKCADLELGCVRHRSLAP